MKEVKNIIVERTSNKINVPEYLISQVVNSFFELIVEDIEKGDFKGSYCRRLGKFIIKPNRVKMLKEKGKLKDIDYGNTVRDRGGESNNTSK